jgi:hypothetical protein
MVLLHAGSWEAANKQLTAVLHRTTGSKVAIHEEIMTMFRKYEQLRNQVGHSHHKVTFTPSPPSSSS